MVKWWHQAAARGIMEAQYNLAVAYSMHAYICLGGLEAAAEYAFVNFKESAGTCMQTQVQLHEPARGH